MEKKKKKKKKKKEKIPYLHNLQLLHPLLQQLLYLPFLLLGPMLPKRISRPPPRVFAEIVRRELGRLPQEGAELWGYAV